MVVLMVNKQDIREEQEKVQGTKEENNDGDGYKGDRSRSSPRQGLTTMTIANRPSPEFRPAENSADPVPTFQARAQAEAMAREVMTRIDKGSSKIKVDDVEQVLAYWKAGINAKRLSVRQDRDKPIHCDTIGCTRDFVQKTWQVSPVARKYPCFVRLLNRYLADHIPKEFRDEFYWTSISLNWDWQSARHRDKGNCGPSAATCFGKFEGGALLVWPGDKGPRLHNKKSLRREDAIAYSNHKQIVLFDGTQAHEVEGYEGVRVSLIWFACKECWEAPPEVLMHLEQLDFWPPSGMSQSDPVRWRTILAGARHRAEKLRVRRAFKGEYFFHTSEVNDYSLVATSTTSGTAASDAIGSNTTMKNACIKPCIKAPMQTKTVSFDSTGMAWDEEFDIWEPFELAEAKLQTRVKDCPPDMDKDWSSSKKTRGVDRYIGWKQQIMAWVRAATVAHQLDEDPETALPKGRRSSPGWPVIVQANGNYEYFSSSLADDYQ